MNAISAVLLAAAIGALAGMGGASFSALASVRSSQLAARVPLAKKIHALSQAIVKLRAAVGKPDFVVRLKKFNVTWNDLAVHQKILAPSDRIAALNSLVLRALPDAQTSPDAFVELAGQTLSVISDMIAAHSQHVLRWQALRAERQLLKHWLATEKSKVMSEDLRSVIDAMSRGRTQKATRITGVMMVVLGISLATC